MDNELIYIDADCYIDHFEGRVDKLRPLGEFAYNLIRKSMECEYKIIISSLVIDELKFDTFGDKIKELINDLKELGKIAYAEETEEDDKKAREIRKQRQTPLNDTKHAVIAQRTKATYLVTRNMKDFEELQDLIKITFPESL